MYKNNIVIYQKCKKRSLTGFAFLCQYIAGLLKYLKDQFTDLKETIIDIIQNQVI